jgi:hypothetical protein
MEEAVLAFVNYKHEQGKGTFRDECSATGWREGARVQHAIPRYPDEAIAATIAYCEYVYERYGRFPANGGPFRTVLAHQAHHLDPDFYERFYDASWHISKEVRRWLGKHALRIPQIGSTILILAVGGNSGY